MNDDTVMDEIGCEEMYEQEADHQALIIEVSGEDDQERQIESDEFCGINEDDLDNLDLYYDPIE